MPIDDGDRKMPQAANSKGKIDNGIFYCYYLVVVSYYLTTHNNAPVDHRPLYFSRGGRGRIPSNNKSMCGDGFSTEDGASVRNLSPTRSRKIVSGGGTGVGDENDGSPINSPNPKKKGMFYYFIVQLFVYYLLFVIFNSYN